MTLNRTSTLLVLALVLPVSAAAATPAHRLLLTELSTSTLDTMTRSELLTERLALTDRRPGLGGSIALMSVGTVLQQTALVGFIFGGTVPAFNLVPGTGWLGVFIGAGVAATVGIIMLVRRLFERADVDREISTIEDRLRNSPPPSPPAASF